MKTRSAFLVVVDKLAKLGKILRQNQSNFFQHPILKIKIHLVRKIQDLKSILFIQNIA